MQSNNTVRVLIIGEILVICVLSIIILLRNKPSTLGIYINKIDKKNIKFKEVRALKNFYEPQPNLKEVINKEWLQEDAVITINSDTLNERFEYPILKPDNTYRIMTLGDSLTYGLNVSTEYNWTEVLEDELNNIKNCKVNFEVVNLGVQGYDTEFTVERFNLRGKKYDPDLVIWFVTDIERMTDETLENTKKINIDENKLESEGKFYEAWNFASRAVFKKYGRDKIVQFQEKQFLRFFELYSGPILFIADNLNRPSERVLENKYVTIIEPGNGMDLKYRLPDGHMNIEGNRIFGQEIAKYLLSSKTISCN